jgi:hypothetical protein
MNLSEDLSIDKELFFGVAVSTTHMEITNWRFIFINYTFIVSSINKYYIFIFINKNIPFPGGLCLLFSGV